MKKIFAIIYFIALTASYSANASQCPYQPTRSIQILAVIKKDGSKSANKTIGKNNVINPQEAVNHSSQIQQIEESETNPTDNKINSEQQVQEIVPAQEQIATEMNPANGVDLDEKLEEEKKGKTNSISEIKTQGHYIGLDVIGNELKFYESFTKPGAGIYMATDQKPTSSGKGIGAGVNYKYAVNFNQFFIAPGIFFEKLGTRVISSEEAYQNTILQQNTQLDIKGRYGVFANIGYDVNSFLAPYAVIGYSMVQFRAKNVQVKNDGRYQTAIEKSVTGANLYGAGLKLKYSNNISFDIEFNTQKFKAKTNTDVPLNKKGYVAVFNTRLNTIKIGVAYNF